MAEWNINFVSGEVLIQLQLYTNSFSIAGRGSVWCELKVEDIPDLEKAIAEMKKALR